MKKQLFVLTFLAVALLKASCEPTAASGETNTSSSSVKQQWQTVKTDVTNAWQDVKQTTTQTWANVKTTTTQAWDTAKSSIHSLTDYTYSQKDKFVANAQTDLDALDRRIKEFSDKTADATDSAKAGAKAKVQSLRNQRAVLNQKLDEVKNATAAGWDDAKTAYNNSYYATKDSLKQAWQWLKGKLKS
jgi:phage-related protein